MTITKIAEKAGVSIGTVDRVIHKRGRVAPETEKRVQEVITQFGYQPNPIARHLQRSKSFTIGMLLPSLSSEDGYWMQCYEGAKKAEKELEPFTIRIIKEEFDRTVDGDCLRAGQKLLEQGVNALVISPVVPEECRLLLAADNCVPYAFIDSPLPDTTPEATIAQNPFRGGLVAGRIMKLLAPEAKEYAVFLMHSAAYNSRERSRGFISYFKNSNDVQVFELSCQGEKSYVGLCKYIDSFFQQHPDVQGVFVVNDAVHHVGNYLVTHELKDRVAVIGYDLIAKNTQGLLEGSIDCLLAQRPQFQGYTVIHELYRKKILQQETEEVHIPVDIFFKENILQEYDLKQFN